MNKILLIIIVLGAVLRFYNAEISLTVLFGCFCILAIYSVICKLFSAKVGLFCAFVIAVSPWHIILSREGFEAVSPLNYFDFFSGRFLFFEAFRYLGAMYLFELFFLIAGIYFLIVKANPKIRNIIIGFFLISPLSGIPLLMVINLTVITGLGLNFLVEKANSDKPILLFAVLYAFGIVYFIDQYFIHFLHLI